MIWFREIFDDWWMRAAGIIFASVVLLVAFNTFSGANERNPLLGVLSYSLVPVLFVLGGTVFVLAILRESQD